MAVVPPPRRASGLSDGMIVWLWVAAVLLCCGFTSGPVILFVGAMCRKRWWIVTGAIYSVIYAAALFVSFATTPASTPTEEFPAGSTLYDTAMGALVGIWFIGLCQSALMIPTWLRWRRENQDHLFPRDSSAPQYPRNPSDPTLAGTDGFGGGVFVGPDPWLASPQTHAVGTPSPSRVDLNTGAAPEIAALPGAGGAVAASIVAERSARGPFLSVEDFVARTHLPPHVIVPVLSAAVIIPPRQPDPPSHRIVDI